MLFRAVAAAALFAFAAATAGAETPEAGVAPAECLAEAEQTLFNVLYAAQAGTISDGNTVYSYAETARQLCPERGEVQGILAELYAMLADVTPDEAGRLLLYGKALDAGLATDAHFTSGAGITVTGPDGASRPLNTYGPVFNLLESRIVPAFSRLADVGSVHGIFADTPLAARPYVQTKGSGVQYEARGLSYFAPVNKAGTAALISGRLLRLRSACSDQAGYLTWALSNYHYRAAMALHTSLDLSQEGWEYALLAKQYASEYSLASDRGDNEAGNFSQIMGIQTELREAYTQLGQ